MLIVSFINNLLWEPGGWGNLKKEIKKRSCVYREKWQLTGKCHYRAWRARTSSGRASRSIKMGGWSPIYYYWFWWRLYKFYDCKWRLCDRLVMCRNFNWKFNWLVHLITCDIIFLLVMWKTRIVLLWTQSEVHPSY